MKRMRGESLKSITNKIVTPIGTYLGSDVLEGFAADAEHLAKAIGESNEFDNEFYKLCIEDNMFIFEFKGTETVRIPEMTMKDLNNILFKDMKAGKACDIYMLTVEHLRYAGEASKEHVLELVNDVIKDISYLTCPEVKKGLSSIIYKGKKKPTHVSSSYRRVTVTPQLGSIIDRYIDPVAEHIFRKVQSPEQFGFTKNVSYLMGAVVRGECQRWALDRKITCYGVSFDGQAAFPSVDRDIQVRELYAVGERGDYLQYSRNIYKNTSSQIKQKGQLSRNFEEFRGSRQGHKRASGHFKSYINPCLTAANSSNLGFNIGPICVSAVCIADDTYVLSDDPRKLQNIIDIIGHYGKRYRLVFGADKTKVTITGSAHDMSYYQDIKMWSLYGDKITVAEDNDHLGLVVSGKDEEQKNVDKNIQSARNSLFLFLGQAFAYRSRLSPTVQHHIWKTFAQPVLRSGLSALPIRPTIMKSVTTFHHSILRGFLRLSPTSPIAPLYFLLGEAPIEAALHLDIFSLFWNIWSNPGTTAFKIVEYILMMADDKSVTWAVHLRILCKQYALPDPLKLLQGNLLPKTTWKELTQTAIIAYHEELLRAKAATNYKLIYLNVAATGLSGRPHPILSGLATTQDVLRAVPHIRMLSGDYLCFATLSIERGSDPQCRLCTPGITGHAPAEDITHIVSRCRGTSDPRDRILPDLLNTVMKHNPSNGILNKPNHLTLCQFILDCTSLNLPNDVRLPSTHPGFIDVVNKCRDLCHSIHKERIRKLKALGL